MSDSRSRMETVVEVQALHAVRNAGLFQTLAGVAGGTENQGSVKRPLRNGKLSPRYG